MAFEDIRTFTVIDHALRIGYVIGFDTYNACAHCVIKGSSHCIAAEFPPSFFWPDIYDEQAGKMHRREANRYSHLLCNPES